MNKNLAKLRTMLRTVSPGVQENADELEAALESAWDEIDGTFAESTYSEKLCGRIEQLRWIPPILSFIIERHGGTVLGSSRGFLHRWEVDIDRGSASCDPNHGHRQLTPAAKRMDVKLPAAEIAAAIVEHQEHASLKWATDRLTVRVLVGEIIPNANKQTTAGRRKRFRKELEAILIPKGWEPAAGKAVGTYRKLRNPATEGGQV